jgi:hypothetical protein
MWAALAMLYVKYELLISAWRTNARALGRIPESPTTAFRCFSLGERLSFFRADVLVALVVAPLMLTVGLQVLPRRTRLPVLAVTTIGLVLLLYVEMHCYWNVGCFVPYTYLVHAIRWGLSNPDGARAYVDAGSLWKIGTALVAILASVAWAQREMNDRRAMPTWLSWVTVPTLLIVLLVPWATRIPALRFHQSVVWLCGAAFLGRSDASWTDFDGLADGEVLATYRRMTGAPAPRPLPEHFGAARHYDVLLFVWETAPARCLDLEGDLGDLPVLRRLRERSWVAARHCSVYPCTCQALFSLFSSWYPPSLESLDRQERYARHTVPGLLHSVRNAGYQHGLYLPFKEPADWEGAHRAVGAARLVTDQATRESQAMDWRMRAALDTRALEALKADVRRWAAQKQPYCAIFLPQVGHAPWADPAHEARPRAPLVRGRALLALQDRWLGELVALLESLGTLERTLILVTADHGVRTVKEDPAFPAGRIDEYSFHVPLLLYAPGVVRDTQVIRWTTSHIDVVPSLLDLLGIGSFRQFEQGSPIWDSRLAGRTTFFWATDYLGADGYQRAGRYYSWSHADGSTRASSRLAFSDDDTLREGSPESQAVIATIQSMMALQRRLTRVGADKQTSGEGAP